MRKLLGNDVASRLLLQAIVANRHGGRDAGFDIGSVDEMTLGGRVAPYTCKTIRLQLLPHRHLVAHALRAACDAFAHIVHDAKLVLHVMPDLVRNDVGAREVAGSAEALRQLLKETEVEVDLAIAGTIERPHGRAAQAARRVHLTMEQIELRPLVGASELLEDA